jgi:precorrin-2 dehydrogenase / sirohydrochlorin ferrochelatase
VPAPPARSGGPASPPPHYPMMLDLCGRRCLVVGGGRVAERKVLSLLACGADVRVVSPAVTTRLEALAGAGRIRLARRGFRTTDLRRALLAFAATDDRAVNRRVAEAAAAAGALANVADDPAAGDFQVPASLRRGDLTVAISTGGGSPALAKRLRQRLEETIGPEYEAFLVALAELRTRAQETIPDPETRQAVYRGAVASDLYAIAAGGDRAAVAARIATLLQERPPAPGAGARTGGT